MSRCWSRLPFSVSGAVRSRFLSAGVVVAGLAVAGLLGDGLTNRVWNESQRKEPEFAAEDFDAVIGQGVTLALLGGFRAITADFLWLANNLAWEQRDLPKTQTMIKAVTAIDPRPLYFWINGARMIAYDMPVWRIEEASGQSPVPAHVSRRIDREQATVALNYLEKGLRHHPGNPFLYLEIANIHLRRLGDVETAAHFYRLAAERPGAPHYAARIHGELLRRLGRPQEALGWLRQVHTHLRMDDPMALPNIVFQRIRELEDELNVPELDRYRPTQE